MGGGAMPRLPYTPEGFGKYLGTALSAPSEILFSWEELCRAAITVGRRSWADVLKFGTYSVLEALWRIAIVRANLVENYDGKLRQSNAFTDLDPSEKAGVSYFLGLALTKLVAEKLFGVPWLLHLDVYRRELAPDLAFPEKPDFVGMDAWQLWIVVESKGRSRTITKKLLNDAKRQVRSLRRISGQLPSLRVAVATYFSRRGLRARMRDPDTFLPTAIDIELSSEQLARAYYRPIVEMILASDAARSRREVANLVEIVTPLAGLDALLTLDERIVTWYLNGQRTYPQYWKVDVLMGRCCAIWRRSRVFPRQTGHPRLPMTEVVGSCLGRRVYDRSDVRATMALLLSWARHGMKSTCVASHKTEPAKDRLQSATPLGCRYSGSLKHAG
jgi:hypothetical protein